MGLTPLVTPAMETWIEKTGQSPSHWLPCQDSYAFKALHWIGLDRPVRFQIGPSRGPEGAFLQCVGARIKIASGKPIRSLI